MLLYGHVIPAENLIGRRSHDLKVTLIDPERGRKGGQEGEERNIHNHTLANHIPVFRSLSGQSPDEKLSQVAFIKGLRDGHTSMILVVRIRCGSWRRKGTPS